MILGKTKFETEMLVRPDDIDMNQHVHGSRYFDYVLAARYDQMERCYRMSMEDFLAAGYAWFARIGHLEYKRPLRMGDRFIVRTWIERIASPDVRVEFEILRLPTRKMACSGYFDYTLVSKDTGRAVDIPEHIAAKYAI